MAKILIVDDDPDIVENCVLVLQKEGHEVASGCNREEGMEQVEGFQPDLIVLDVMMEQPDDGIVFAQDLRKKGFKKPILMLTSIGKVTGMDYGKDDSLVPVDAFEEKPIAPKKLLEQVDALLKKEG